MKSMTGFGRAAAEVEGRRVTVVLQTVNHRNLDLVIRLPEELRGAEVEVRERVGAVLARGRCEVQVSLSEGSSARHERLDPAAIRSWLEAARPLVEAGLVEPRITLGDLARAGNFAQPPPPAGGGLAELPRILELLAEALDQAVQAREFEGERLARALTERLKQLEQSLERLEGRRAESVARAAAALRARLAEMLGDAEVSEVRIAQEIAILADRSDVREELDRLRAHVEQFRSVAAGSEPLGRRLDFLVQEMMRELNTLGAKCRDVEMTRCALDAKVVCEQLREQIQNVE